MLQHFSIQTRAALYQSSANAKKHFPNKNKTEF